jgi:hypothetical protein
VQSAGLGNKVVLILFALKILVGIIGGMYNHFILHDMADAYGYTQQSLIEYDNLIHHPKIFFTDSLPSVYDNSGSFFGSSNSFWNNLRNNILIKAMGVFNIFSSGNYYINSLFFNFCCFLGHVALYKTFKSIYKKEYWTIIIAAFLLPSTLCYSSIISKDLIVFTALSIFCYCLYTLLEVSFTKKRIIYLILSFLTILLMRNFVAAILLPCAIAYFTMAYLKVKPIKVCISILSGVIIFLFIAQLLPQKINPLKIVVDRQQSFFALGEAKSQYHNDTLQNNVFSFIKAAPRAIRHSFLSPYPTEFDNLYLNIFSLEMLTYFALLVMFFLVPCPDKLHNKSFVYFAILFAIVTLVFIGFITPNAGTLVRYRSIYIPFLIMPVLASISWGSVKNLFIFKKKV